MLGRLSFAAAMFGAMAFSVAIAAPLGTQSDLGGDGSNLVTLAKKGGGGGKGGGGKGGGGKGGKSGKHHRHGGGGIFIGVGYCAITAASCAERYGTRSRRYYWCLSDAGC